jgi:HSP20 family protein
MLPALQNGSQPTFATPTNRLSALLDDVFFPKFANGGTALPLALWEDEQQVFVEADVPGLTEQDLDLSVQENLLVLRGERKCERLGKYDTRWHGRFEQHVRLPETVDPNQVEAKLANGVLRVAIGKRPESKPRKIAVKVD